MKEVYTLKITAEINGIPDTVYPVVLTYGESLILIDTGFAGCAGRIEEAMRGQGLNPQKIKYIVVTHHDYDSAGAIKEMRERTGAKVISGIEEEPYISGRYKAQLLDKLESMQAYLPEGQMDFSRALCREVKRVAPVAVDITVKGGDYFPWCGDCMVIDTPGHTKGHISLYIPKYRTLIAGDALDIAGGREILVNRDFAFNLHQSKKSSEKLKEFDIETMICYRSGAHQRKRGQ